MTSREEQRAERERVGAVVGHRIVAVRYFELPYEDRMPQWDGPEFHALDFGLEWDLDDGSTWSFIWQTAGDKEALLAYAGRLVGDELSLDGEFGIWPVADTTRWQPLRDQAITSVDVDWEPLPDGTYCPLTWSFEFDGGRQVALTLGTRDQHGAFRTSADDVAVFFDRSPAVFPSAGHHRS